MFKFTGERACFIYLFFGVWQLGIRYHKGGRRSAGEGNSSNKAESKEYGASRSRFSQLVSARWFVERIMKYEIREVRRSQLASFKNDRGVLLLVCFVFFSGGLWRHQSRLNTWFRVCWQGWSDAVSSRMPCHGQGLTSPQAPVGLEPSPSCSPYHPQRLAQGPQHVVGAQMYARWINE